MKEISEKTTVTLSLLLIIVGGISYVTFIFFQGSANAKAIEEIKEKQVKIEGIATDIAVIKEKLDRIEVNLNKRKGF